jgi:O-ureido-D-serine cyclo-ligase
MKSLALVTCAASLPIDFDMPPLLEAFGTLGLHTLVCDWEDPSINWSGFDAVLLRSPWNYSDRLPAFLRWCERVEAKTCLLNPAVVARFALDKHYLAALSSLGVPTVPTRFIETGMDPNAPIRAVFAAHPQSTDIVIKPTIGAYSKNVQRFARDREQEACAYAAGLLANGNPVMVQPYLPSIDHVGETNLTYFDGSYSHAICKSALLMADGTVNVPTQDLRAARVADEDEQAVAKVALQAAAQFMGLTPPLLYGRVDLIRDTKGCPVVLELDICEPSLNLAFSHGSAMHFAQSVAARLASCRANA